jgi:hypothetical protein
MRNKTVEISVSMHDKGLMRYKEGLTRVYCGTKMRRRVNEDYNGGNKGFYAR